MLPGAPFIGPRPFTEADAEVFFGREGELAALTAEVVSTQIVLLYASSGSGKSSLLGAGLVPTMRDEDFSVSQVRVKTLISSDGRSPVDLLRQIITELALGSSPDRPSLLILDQFEEIVVSVTYEELRALSETVYGAMAGNPLARVVISFREEYLARIEELFNKATEVSVGHFHLDRLSRLGAHDAFERSLETVGFQVEREAQELFLEKLVPPTKRRRSEVGFEPLYLQLLGAQLWSSLANRGSATTSPVAGDPADADRVVTVADVGRLVDFDQAIEEFYDSTIDRACTSSRFAEKTLRDWIDKQLVTADETRSVVRRRVPETEGLPTSLLDDLVRLGLLRTEPRAEDLWIELAHDQLVERVREFNRVWWTERIHTSLLNRSTRVDIAMAASRWDMQQWIHSRSTLWSFSTGIRESGMQLSRWFSRWLPSSRTHPRRELDRLALRAFVVSGSLINLVILLYRLVIADPPSGLTSTGIEGLDAETAKRRLQATSLNLGRTDQLLSTANVCATVSWGRLLSRILTRSATGAATMGRRQRWQVGVLLGTDAGLTLLRWALRNGLIVTCLEPASQISRSRVLGNADVGAVRRFTSLEEVASWSETLPVLLVLDEGSGALDTAEFERFASQEVPLYESALSRRGAAAAWCRRADVRRRGWRGAISGIGFPSRGRRTYYMIENGNVVAWRVVGGHEFPVLLRGDPGDVPDNGQFRTQAEQMRKRFTETLTSLIVSNEAAPSIWRSFTEQFFASALGRRGTRHMR